MNKKQRVVISGLGFVSPLGSDPTAALAHFQSGQTNFMHSRSWPKAACASAPLPPADSPGSRLLNSWRHRRYLNRGARLAVEAALLAVSSSGFALNEQEADSQNKPLLPEQSGLVCAAGPMLDLEDEFERDGLGKEALWLLRWLPNTAQAALSVLLGLHGQGLTICTACAAGLQALGEAFRQISQGRAEIMLVAAGDSRLSRTALMAYAQAGVLRADLDLKDQEAPGQACRPFDIDRKGFAAGEGAAAFVLETLDSARRRAVRPVAEIIGYSANMDAKSLLAPDPKAEAAGQCLLQSMDDAALKPSDIDWICAHGTGTAANDAAESALLEKIFSPNRAVPLITALKSWIGHCASACGALELALALICLGQGFLPGIKNLQHPISTKINLIPCNTACPGRTGLVESFGFGGQNAALALRLWT